MFTAIFGGWGGGFSFSNAPQAARRGQSSKVNGHNVAIATIDLGCTNRRDKICTNIW
jgi:hypothetical protein